ncbi:MAG TPA: hypothetical protein VGQ83_29490 [Polyangia bacterium]|jgi:hypothetical protein
MEDGAWQDPEDGELVAQEVDVLSLRGRPVRVPRPEEYGDLGIALECAPRVQVFELCRYVAATARDDVLATAQERRGNVPPSLRQILQLEEWNHPDVVCDDKRPSGSTTFQQIARVLETGDVRHLQPVAGPNTHWKNWPEGGRL